MSIFRTKCQIFIKLEKVNLVEIKTSPKNNQKIIKKQLYLSNNVKF